MSFSLSEYTKVDASWGFAPDLTGGGGNGGEGKEGLGGGDDKKRGKGKWGNGKGGIWGKSALVVGG